MKPPDYYTCELWRMAVVATGEDGFLFYRGVRAWVATARVGSVGRRGEGPTLADALYALLVDLGVTPPERPSAEQVDAAWQDLMEAEDFDEFLDGMRDYPDRLAVLALLSEEGR